MGIFRDDLVVLFHDDIIGDLCAASTWLIHLKTSSTRTAKASIVVYSTLFLTIANDVSFAVHFNFTLNRSRGAALLHACVKH